MPKDCARARAQCRARAAQQLRRVHPRLRRLPRGAVAWLAAQVVRPVLADLLPRRTRRRKAAHDADLQVAADHMPALLRWQRQALGLALAQLRKLDVGAGIAVADEAQARSRR